MENEQKERIAALRLEGWGYKKISDVLCISANTVKSFCQRNGLGGMRADQVAAVGDMTYCKQCGAVLLQVQGGGVKKFCTDACRLQWWHKHPEQIRQQAIYSFTCLGCGTAFTAYGNRHRKYCSHACYIRVRFYGDDHA